MDISRFPGLWIQVGICADLLPLAEAGDVIDLDEFSTRLSRRGNTISSLPRMHSSCRRLKAAVTSRNVQCKELHQAFAVHACGIEDSRDNLHPDFSCGFLPADESFPSTFRFAVDCGWIHDRSPFSFATHAWRPSPGCCHLWLATPCIWRHRPQLDSHQPSL